MDSSIFCLVYFKQDNSFIIISKKDVDGKVKDGRVMMNYGKKWYSGRVLSEGSETKCHNDSKKLGNNCKDLRSSDDEDHELYSNKKKVAKKPITYESEYLRFEELKAKFLSSSKSQETNFAQSSKSKSNSSISFSSIPSKIDNISKGTPNGSEQNKNNHLFNKSGQCESYQNFDKLDSDEDRDDDLSLCSTPLSDHVKLKKRKIIEDDSLDECDILEKKNERNDDQVYTFIIEIRSQLSELNTAVNEIKQVISKTKKLDDEEWLDSLVYNDIDLLTIDQSAFNKYVIAVMEALFTYDELSNGLIKSDNSKSKRQTLDIERVNILRQAVKHKFKVPNRKMTSTWNEVCKIAKRCCYDSIKKKKISSLP
ncbi:unnamed protein product [Brachionus calyciflorus]|uniref:BEN domain-containing protein n=1 Tax=Brachionus calyciflorus TaxID=104777 RepID=A0A814EK89_9BILA|nr:unnamed protein product [Brachionus calyciflorus]